MNLRERFPTIMAALDEDIDESRFLILVDVNYDDVDSDEFDVFDPSDYNYLIYITERLQLAMGEERMQKFIEQIAESGVFEDFYAPEIDAYGVMTQLDQEAIMIEILGRMERLLAC